MTEHGGPMAALGWSHLCLMRILFSCGDPNGMKELILKMEKTGRESNIPPWIAKQMTAWQTRLRLAQNELDAASQWAEESGLNTSGKPRPLHDISFFTLMEYIVLARALIAQERLDDATRLLQWLLETAEMGGRTSRAIEMMILQALAFRTGGNTDQAMISLERALTLAEPRGFYRIFVDEGPSMAPLLYTALDRGIAPDYVRRLLQAFPTDEPKQIDPAKPPGFEAGYIEPLTDRETEVLRLIAKGLTNPEIATRLFLSLHTVKTHTRNIYSKLGVHTRTEAVATARTLGILPSTLVGPSS